MAKIRVLNNKYCRKELVFTFIFYLIIVFNESFPVLFQFQARKIKIFHALLKTLAFRCVECMAMFDQNTINPIFE